MGHSVTPKYRVEVRGNFTRMGIGLTPAAWRGKVSEQRLEEYRQSMNQSFLPGGVNEHVSRADGFVHHISYARIVRQSDGQIMCAVRAPMFEII